MVLVDGVYPWLDPNKLHRLRGEIEKTVISGSEGMCKDIPVCNFSYGKGLGNNDPQHLSITIQIKGINGEGVNLVLTRKRLKTLLEELIEEFFSKKEVKEVEFHFVEPNP